MDGIMNSIQLPEEFINRMRNQLGSELNAFLYALEQPPVRGIRMNPLKKAAGTETLTSGEKIPWAENGYYLDNDSTAGSTVLHETGAFYIQEPGAMLPAAVLNAQPGERILDLCAAPGGKSTQIGCNMKGEGLLVCNEPVPKRAAILSRNIERMGLPHTVVTCAMPDRLAEKWPEAFDAVMVDAPCSGEGMFRRDPETRLEWTEEKAAGCAERQREILRAAARLVRPGGRIVYSTCTYNPTENEENAAWFIKKYPEFRMESFLLNGIDAPEGTYTCYPHRMKGEGQFAALFRKTGISEGKLPTDHSLPVPSPNDIAVFNDAFPGTPKANHLFGNTLVTIRNLPDLKGIRTLRVGLHLGEVRGKNAFPDHAAALCFRSPGIQTHDMNQEEAVRFLAGETIPGDEEGWTLMMYKSIPAGWGKGSGGIIKNHYPKGLRGLHYIP